MPDTTLHTPDLLLIRELVERIVQVLPPFEEQRVADEFEPGRKFQGRIIEHLAQLLWCHVARGLHFIGIVCMIDIGLDEKNVIDWKNINTQVQWLRTPQRRQPALESTHFHALPIFHHLAPCSGSASGIETSRSGSARL